MRDLNNITASFNKLIGDLQLVDVQTTNGLFTWQNKCSGTRHIASQLDIFLVSESTLVGEGEIGATVLPDAGSDHWLICLEWGRLGEFVNHSDLKNFGFSARTFKD